MMRSQMVGVTAVVLLAGGAAWGQAGAKVKPPSAKTVLKTLRKDHPRLVLTDKRLAAIKKAARGDKVLRKAIAQVIAAADAMAGRPLVIGGRRGSARVFFRRMYTLGLAWRLTGRKEYARRARADLLKVAAMGDWRPSYFLDTAKYLHGTGIGYDWFYSALPEADRRKIRATLIKNGLNLGLTAYKDKWWWVKWGFNWNQVTNSALAIAALAIAESEPALAGKIVPAAIGALPYAIRSYGPDGAWAEGANYWEYATLHTVCGIEALRTALGTDYGLSKMPGFLESGMFPIFITGPSGMYLHYSDCPENRRRGSIPFLFWFARNADSDLLAAVQTAMLKRHRASVFDVIWYRPARRKPSARKLPLDKFFGGPTEIAVFRSAWDDPKALFVSLKTSFNSESHAHLDLGAFEVEALGVRWARDLGSANYSLPGYWGATRWKYFRTGSASHNVPMLDNANQHPAARGRFVKFQGAPESAGSRGISHGAFGIVDLSKAYAPAASKALRGVRIPPGRRSVLVQDEMTLEKSCEFAWGMTTSADIAVRGNKAALRQGGKRCRVTILEPEGAVFTVESAAQKPPQKPNKGVRRLMIRLKDQKGKVRVAVLIAPVWRRAAKTPAPKIEPLSKWKSASKK